MVGYSSRKTATMLSVIALAVGLAVQSAQAELNSPPRVDQSFPNPQPTYPDSAQANGERGIVLVDVLVRPSGKPARAKISRSSGYEDLDTAAIEGVLNWRFIPAVRDGEQVSDWMTVKIVYQPPVLAPSPSPASHGNP